MYVCWAPDIALSASAYAAGLPRNSVGSKQIKAGAAKNTELSDGAGSGLDADSLDGFSSETFPRGGILTGSANSPASDVTGLLLVDKLLNRDIEFDYACPASQSSAGTVIFNNDRTVNANVFWDTGGATPG